jgi:hypothetical protein
MVAGVVQAGVRLTSDMTQEKLAQPGESYSGTLVLRNSDSAPVEVKVYHTDYSFASDGSNDYGEPGSLTRSNAKWISLSRELVTVPPNGTERVDYEVKVPAAEGLNLAGTYWSMLMVEPISASSLESAADLPKGTAQINQIIRYGVQVVTHVGKAGKAELVFTNPQLIKDDGQRVFAIDVENTGQRWLNPGLLLELYSQSGTPVGKFQGPAKRLYPGTSARFQMGLGNIPNGKYLGLVVADGTGDNLFGANVELEIE